MERFQSIAIIDVDRQDYTIQHKLTYMIEESSDFIEMLTFPRYLASMTKHFSFD